MSDWLVSCHIPTSIPFPTHIHMTNIYTKMLFLAVKAVRQEDGFSLGWTWLRSRKNKITNQNNNNFKGFWRVSLGWTDCWLRSWSYPPDEQLRAITGTEVKVPPEGSKLSRQPPLACSVEGSKLYPPLACSDEVMAEWWLILACLKSISGLRASALASQRNYSI